MTSFRRLRPFCVLILLALAVAARPLKAQQAPAAPLPAEVGKVANEALGWLTHLLRIDTTNPPGNELAAAKYIAEILQKEGITAELLEAAPERSAVVARLRSAALPDPSRALLLVAHLDVVGVDRAKWSVDPFGGVVGRRVRRVRAS